MRTVDAIERLVHLMSKAIRCNHMLSVIPASCHLMPIELNHNSPAQSSLAGIESDVIEQSDAITCPIVTRWELSLIHI